MTLFCAIPARAGSKRLPHKNLLPLNGKPMLAYTIEAALESDCFDTVYVCTEDEQIADTARQYGAEVPLLVPENLTGDLVASHVPCQHVADYLIEQGERIKTLVCLQPTSPLRSVEDIRASVERFEQGDIDFLVSVTPIDPHYFHWAVAPQDDGYWRMWFGSQYMKERPLLPPVHRPNGSIKIAHLPALRQLGNFFGARLGVIETPEERSIHVATQFEFDLCSFLLTRQPA